MMQQIINHLSNHPNNSISIEYEGRKKMNPYAATSRYLFTKSIIETGWTSVEAFLKGLKKEGFPSGTKVFLRTPNGTTSKIVGEPIVLQFSTYSTEQNRSTMNIATTNHQNTTMQPYYGMHGGMMGVHPAESKLDALQSKYDDLKERHDDLKIDYKDLKSVERRLKEENSALKIEVNTAEKHKELAILQAQLGQKTFMDSEAMKSLANNIAPVLPQLIGGGQAQIGMGSATANLSNEKRQFMDFIASDRVQESDVNFIYKLYKHILKDEAFSMEVQKLLTQFNIS